MLERSPQGSDRFRSRTESGFEISEFRIRLLVFRVRVSECLVSHFASEAGHGDTEKFEGHDWVW